MICVMYTCLIPHFISPIDYCIFCQIGSLDSCKIIKPNVWYHIEIFQKQILSRYQYRDFTSNTTCLISNIQTQIKSIFKCNYCMFINVYKKKKSFSLHSSSQFTFVGLPTQSCKDVVNLLMYCHVKKIIFNGDFFKL